MHRAATSLATGRLVGTSSRESGNGRTGIWDCKHRGTKISGALRMTQSGRIKDQRVQVP